MAARERSTRRNSLERVGVWFGPSEKPGIYVPAEAIEEALVT
jgi:hypothetical protein